MNQTKPCMKKLFFLLVWLQKKEEKEKISRYDAAQQ